MIRALAAVALFTFVVASAQADVAWSPPNGSAANFYWENGHNSDTNLFGSPNYYGGDNLYFLGSDFAPYSDDGSVVTATDTLGVDLFANPNQKFLEVRVFESGDYNITGGTSNTVSANLEMTGTAAGHPMSPFLDDFSFSAAGDSGGSQAWSDNATLLMSIAVPDVTALHLDVSNTLIAVSDGAGGTASIYGSFTLLTVSVVTVPEPTSLALIALGAVGVLWRRR